MPAFVELILSDWHTAEERQPALDGMAALDSESRAKFGKAFANATNAEQTDMLTAFEDTPMFSLLKPLVVNGYFTSEVGATSQAGYNPMPGVYAEVVYDAEQDQWIREDAR